MGPKFAVRDDAVNRHATHLETAEASMNAQAAAFLAAVEPLPAEWRGSSYASWSRLTEAWNAAVADLNRALGAIRSCVRDAGGLYDRYESQQTAALAAVHGASDWDGARFRS
ncbi:WXG100 family type VII secretion target [Nakamurella endophytica]|uniref:WXG100 family type VII secretion target n=1 Tax=Nakamurella endophytica TaxID=1748367 RepID=A0A917SSB6_9ACTN|nr:hypothetical protein [Nakamurella endophytica]GGL96250.1 hypothetical protein GCM10011594_14990 [Nakamurella endophytica]